MQQVFITKNVHVFISEMEKRTWYDFFIKVQKYTQKNVILEKRPRLCKVESNNQVADICSFNY